MVTSNDRSTPCGQGSHAPGCKVPLDPNPPAVVAEVVLPETVEMGGVFSPFTGCHPPGSQRWLYFLDPPGYRDAQKKDQWYHRDGELTWNLAVCVSPYRLPQMQVELARLYSYYSGLCLAQAQISRGLPILRAANHRFQIQALEPLVTITMQIRTRPAVSQRHTHGCDNMTLGEYSPQQLLTQ